ncbi:hypothetical protein BOX15_Mlig028539g2 [Macrostomum lignano]|uniref:Transmembrane protein n=1 Tax=Macrostomum lignano TaxID=282301 RepID=A0A267E1E3_9PLAT|nr:hypothetical protein BOX15_Mlig028539g2 [Macrostomum lignano]
MPINYDNVFTDVDLADSAEFLSRLIEVEQCTEFEDELQDEAEDDEEENPAAEKGGRTASGLSGFRQWLTRTKQLGRRASRLLQAVDSMHAPRDQRNHMADMIRLNLLLECNSAIGFNADGTLRNTEAAASVTPFEDDLDDEDSDEDSEHVRDDAEVLMTKERVLSSTSSGSHSLIIVTILILIGSVVSAVVAPDWLKWQSEWLLLVTSTAASLMISVAVFARAGRRRRSIAAYREMGKELQSNRIMLSTIKHG